MESEHAERVADGASHLWKDFMKTTPELCAKEASPCSCVTGYKSKILRWNRVEAPLDMSNDISGCFLFPYKKKESCNMVNFKENEELKTLNHSCAHLMAQAIKHLYPQAKFWVGPVV